MVRDKMSVSINH